MACCPSNVGLIPRRHALPREKLEKIAQIFSGAAGGGLSGTKLCVGELWMIPMAPSLARKLVVDRMVSPQTSMQNER